MRDVADTGWVKAIIVTCPHCGARLKVDGTLLDLRCEYCGTSSRIQKRSRVLERVLPPPPERPDAPREIAVQRRTWILPVTLASLMTVPAVVGILVASRARSQTAVPTPGSGTTVTPYKRPAPGEKPSSWLGTDSAILVDLTGDGVLDIIGRARRSNPDAVTIVAIDGATGKRRWESESLGDYSDVYVHPLALAGDQLVFASSRGEVRAFSSADGEARWTTKLDERVKWFCDGGDSVIAVGADDVERRIQRADGARRGPAEADPPSGAKPASRGKPVPCTRLPADKVDHGWTMKDRELARSHELDFDRLYVGPSGRVLSGSRRKGTRVPMLVAIDDANKQRWRIEVPIDPLAAEERAPGQVVVGADTVCAAYQLTGDKRQMSATCFVAADGTRRWHELLTSHYASALLISGDALLVSMGGVLESRDLKTGAVRWRFEE